MFIRKTVLFLIVNFVAFACFAKCGMADIYIAKIHPVQAHSSYVYISPFQDDIDIKVSPNPANDEFTVVANIVYTRIQMYNIIGKHIKNFSPSITGSYDISDVPGGIYILRFIDSHSQVIKSIKLYKKS